jgi:predicted phosphodiesterase
MRVRIFSDVHLESTAFDPPRVEADVVVLAGDIGEGAAGLMWARERFEMHIIYVLGNHEFYGERLPDALEELRGRASDMGIHLLENASAVIGGVRFLGATLWTDFRVNGCLRPEGPSDNDARIAMHDARKLQNDYRYIRFGPKRKKQRDRLRPHDVLAMHRASVAWLFNELNEPFSGKTVVVTHHAPHLRSIPSDRVGAGYVPCYASHLPDLVCAPVDLWIHGHFHVSLDYEVGGTRVIANPRGRRAGANPLFLEGLVVEV